MFCLLLLITAISACSHADKVYNTFAHYEHVLVPTVASIVCAGKTVDIVCPVPELAYCSCIKGVGSCVCS